MVERLTGGGTLHVLFRQLNNVVQGATARTVLDAGMELVLKDLTVAAQRRRVQVTIDLERTSRGWKIV
jgi:hypothetical protein